MLDQLRSQCRAIGALIRDREQLAGWLGLREGGHKVLNPSHRTVAAAENLPFRVFNVGGN
jgi:hypothetical protein